MKKIVMPSLLLALFVVVGCGSNGAEPTVTSQAGNQESRLPDKIKTNSAIPDAAKQAMAHAIPMPSGAH